MPHTRSWDVVGQDLAPGRLIDDLRAAAGPSRREPASRTDTTPSAVSRLEEGGGARNRSDTLAHVATAPGRHLVGSFPEHVPDEMPDAVRVA